MVSKYKYLLRISLISPLPTIRIHPNSHSNNTTQQYPTVDYASLNRTYSTMFHRIMYGMFFLLLAIQVFANPVPSNSEYVKDVTLAGRGSYFKNIVPLRTDGKKVIIPNCAQDCFNLGRHALRCPKDDYTCGCNEKKYSKLSELSIKCVESNCNVGPGASKYSPRLGVPFAGDLYANACQMFSSPRRNFTATTSLPQSRNSSAVIRTSRYMIKSLPQSKTFP